MTLDPLEPDQTEILAAVGQCLAVWTHVELQIVGLFAEIIGTDDTTAGAILDGIISFEARVSAMQAAANYTLRFSPLQPLTTKLLTRCLKQSKKRAEMAHFALVSRVSKWNLTDQTPDDAPVIIPYLTFGPKPQRAGIPLIQIRERAERFKELTSAIWWLTAALKAGKEQPVKAPPPEPDLIRQLQKAADQSP